MSTIIDARGLSCPQPVLMALDAIRKGNQTELVIKLDSETSKENVTRAVKSQGWSVERIEEKNKEFELYVRKTPVQS